MRTDTVYGLLARFDSQSAVERIFEIKKRPQDKGMPVLCADMDMVAKIAVLDEGLARELSEIWPARITALLYKTNLVSKIVSGNSDKVAVRIPADDDLRSLILDVGAPLVATSANKSGEPEARSYKHLKESGIADEVDMTIDGGEVQSDIKPSVIIDFTINPHQIIRQ